MEITLVTGLGAEAKGGLAQQWPRHSPRCCVTEMQAPRSVPDGALLYFGVESEPCRGAAGCLEPISGEASLFCHPAGSQAWASLGRCPQPRGRTGAALPGEDELQNGPGSQRAGKGALSTSVQILSPAAYLLCQTLTCSVLQRQGDKRNVVKTLLPACRMGRLGEQQSARTWAQSCSSQTGWCSSTEAKMWKDWELFTFSEDRCNQRNFQYEFLLLSFRKIFCVCTYDR